MGAEHLLFALIEHGAAWRRTLPPPCREELRAFVEQELDRLPANNAYRDAAVPALAKDVVDALRPSRWSLFEKLLAPKDLMQRVGLLPRVRDWLSWATMDDLLVDDAVAEASALAVDRHHFSVKIGHFLRVIADQHWLDAPPALAAALDTLLSANAMAERVEEPTLSEELALLVAKTKVNARMAQRPATSDMLLAIALREDEVKASFEQVGVTTLGLLQFLAHGTRALLDDPESGMVDVSFENDDFTPVEVVKELMIAHFELTPAEAKARIATAHEEGSVVVATLAAAEARSRADRARLQALESRYPLRITLRSTT